MEVIKDELIPPAGFSREIGHYLAGLEDVRAQTRRIVADLTPAELYARLTPGAHQIGGLLLHIGETEWWWICAIAGGEEITEEKRRLTFMEDTVETDFALKGLDAATCIDFLDRISGLARDTLMRFTDEDMDVLIPYEADGQKYQSSLRWILHHVLEHEAHHRGQISMIKRLLREGTKL